MKIKIILFTLIISTIYIFNACKDSGTDPENNGGQQVADSSYFPANEQAYYKYDISRTDSNSSQSTGSRSTYYSGTSVIGGTTYQIQVDSLVLTGQAAIVDSMYFRKSNSGVFYYLDTTGLSTSLPGIDTLIQYITLSNEMRLLLFPLLDNSSWEVFKMNIDYQSILNFNPILLSAVYDGKETLDINLTPPRTVEAVRIKFSISLRFDPFQPARSYTAYGWIAQGYGFVKWQGNGTIIGVFTGNGVDLDDTSSVYTQDLVQFNLVDN
jgi:hypothetical protein